LLLSTSSLRGACISPLSQGVILFFLKNQTAISHGIYFD
jgi:hypothetical protein